MSAQTTRLRTGVLRPLLAVLSVLFVCLTLFTYFLFDASFYTGNETLTALTTQNIVRHECETATAYLRACLPDDSAQIDVSKIDAYRTHFKSENNNFFFFFWRETPGQSDNKTLVLNNYSDAQRDISFLNYPIPLLTESTTENTAFNRILPEYSLDAYVRTPLTAKDDFYRAQQLVRVLDRLKYPALLLFLLCAILEGRLWIKLCEQAAHGHVSAALLELDDAPYYLLLLFWLFSTAAAGYFLSKQLRIVYEKATFAFQGDVRPAVYISILLLFLITFLTTLPVTSLCSRMTKPQWLRRSVLYRAVSTPSIERRLQMWLTVLVTLEFSVFLLLFLGFSIENGRMYVVIDAVVTAVILLIAFVQSRGTSAYMRATHRIALDGHGTVPTGDLRGKSLEHVQNINFLSRSAGEQMQLRFINEAFGTKLIRNVSQSLRDPLTAVTAEAERLQSGTLTAQEKRESVAQINDLSQELKQAIEDLLRIANASAEGNEPQCAPTDAAMMLAQAVGEFYDQFRQKQIELVQLTSDEPLTVSADGTFMWTVFESVLQEFLQYAVSGTRVFLQADADDNTVRLCIRGTVREDALPARRSLSLPTAKIFTEKQGGTYRDALENDMLTVELLFPKAEMPVEQE